MTSISPKIALVQFPGSNCDMDCEKAFRNHFDIQVVPVWHQSAELPQVDGVILPGGFSFGDYLRSGALASHSPIMAAVKEFARKGGSILGICNGFQILTESHLLPGALLKNAGGKFVCKNVKLSVIPGLSKLSQDLANEEITLPIAHGEGRYFHDADGLKSLRDNGQIYLTYAEENPNGSCENIAGIVSRNGKIFGLMPHPERAVRALVGSSADGQIFLRAFLASIA